MDWLFVFYCGMFNGQALLVGFNPFVEPFNIFGRWLDFLAHGPCKHLRVAPVGKAKLFGVVGHESAQQGNAPCTAFAGSLHY